MSISVTRNNGLVHGIFTPWEKKAEQLVSLWGIDRAVVEAEIERARRIGLIDEYERKVRENRFLDAVFAVYLEDLFTSFFSVRALMDRMWAKGSYSQWVVFEAVAQARCGIELIPGADSIPKNTIRLEVIDFGANRSSKQLIADMQREQAGRLAGIGVLCGAVQNPCWVRDMGSVHQGTPFVCVGGLLMTACLDGAQAVPEIQGSNCTGHSSGELHLTGRYTDANTNGAVMPTVWKEDEL
ncbi:MAG: hypothetical protein WCT28_02385 [Patescibacteria group bacterium]|jgi:hypothetical protein